MLKVTLRKSVIGHNKKQRATVKALGLGKIGSCAVHSDNECVMGMIRRVGHLLEVDELQDPVEASK